MSDEACESIPDSDHRALAQRLGLLHFQDEAPGMAFWHPRGWTLYRLLEEAVRAHVRAAGYQEVRTPQVLRRPIWERSGHWGSFHGSMFVLGEGADQAALKPVSCPGHIQIVRRMAPSWRDLPIRIAELGLVHRDEERGALHGLLRLKQFTQDDGHIFCAPDDAPAEAERFCRELLAFYRRFGLDDISLALSLRPPPGVRLGDDAAWDRAERVLADIIERLGVPCEVQPGAGAIYGPKLELLVRDRRGRAWQCGTVQIDFVMPQRFDLRYVDAGGERRHVAILHRALFGSLERFLGILLEHHGAELPAWLAPEQVAVVPVGPAHAEAAAAAHRALAAAGLRARVDADAATLGKRVLRAHQDGVPFVAVVGEREIADGTLSARDRAGTWSGPAAEIVAELARRCAPPA
ncbi:MAG TPA: threonine--tRNA ligase [Kofleriaceae bacterium]|nr:threonine--tRNA ligase [Kofleriaceae bacterium]